MPHSKHHSDTRCSQENTTFKDALTAEPRRTSQEPTKMHFVPSAFHASPVTSYAPLDGVSGFLIKKELFDKASDPFSGAGQEERFFAWAAMLENKLRGVHLTDMDQIGVLQANTCGEANSLVNTYLAAGAIDPSHAVKEHLE